MSTSAKICSDALRMFLGKSGSQILSFASGIVLARLLALGVFGMLLAIQTFKGVASSITGGGMGQALVRAKGTTRTNYCIIFSLQLAIGGLIYSALFVTARLIADAYGNPLYADMIRVMALSLLFHPFTNMPVSVLKEWCLTRFGGLATIKQLHECADITLIRRPIRFDLKTIIEDGWKWETKTASQPIHA